MDKNKELSAEDMQRMHGGISDAKDSPPDIHPPARKVDVLETAQQSTRVNSQSSFKKGEGTFGASS